ncbi:MAG: hypothetical protein PHR81_11440, partial [Bacteroidales bacterium]|nr:hypothetical protein [Bacteroidales bacterium]MDD4215411.1 hypothetical protein [Bacteroidales bacterium]
MKKFTFLVVLIFCFGIGHVFSQTGFQKLYKITGSLPITMAICWSAQQTTDGGYIMAGFQNSGIPMRADVIKTTSTGAIDWKYSYGLQSFIPGIEDFTKITTPFCIRQTSDGGYIITGQQDGKCFLMKITSNGQTISWTKQYADKACGNMVKQTSDGGYIVVGYRNDDTKSDSTSIYLLKTASNGNISWDKMFKISSVDDDMGNSVVEVSDGFILAGYTTEIFGTDTTLDMVLLKTNTSGTHQWTTTFGDNSYSEVGNDIKLHSDGSSLLITGYTDRTVSGIDGSDLFIMKTNSSGTPSWTSAYNLATEDIGHRIEQTTTGLAVMGTTISIWGLTFLDMFLMQTNTTGTPSMGEVYSQTEPAHNYMADGQKTADGGFVMGGWGQGLTSMDFLLLKSDANGITGCNENAQMPEQRTYSPTSASVTPTITTPNSSSSKTGIRVDLTAIVEDVCSPAELLVAEAGNNQSVCVNQSITLGGSPTGSGGSGSYTYSWSPSTYLNNAGIANPTCTPTSAGTTTYTITVNDGSTTATDIVTVTATANVTPTFTQLGPYCVGATPGVLPTTSTNGITGTWNPATINTTSQGTTQYTFTPDGGQCALSTTIDINVTPALSAYITGNDSICIKTSPGALTVVASGGGGSGTYTYLWYRNGASIGVTSSTYNPGPIT